jgi:excisionase family DNA binding protein
MDIKAWLTVSQVSERYKISGQAVRKAIKERRISAHKLGHQWLCSKEIVEHRWGRKLARKMRV